MRLFILIATLILNVSALAQDSKRPKVQANVDDCGRLVEGSPGHFVPLNLCSDGTLPAPGCKCPGTVKWVDKSPKTTNVDDCARLVQASPGHFVPLNLCSDGTLPLPGCKCPGKVKWVDNSKK